MSKMITREYQGHTFTFREDGYFNMTTAAKAYGKRLQHFMENQETQEYIQNLSAVLNSRDSGQLELLQSTRGRYGGTWGHPKLAVFFARWLDVKFAVFCDMVIDDILNKKAELTVTKPEQSMSMQVPQSFPEALRLAAELAERNQFLEKEYNEVTVDEYRALSHRYMTHSEKVKLGKTAAALMRELGIKIEPQIRTVKSRGETTKVKVNVYPRHILEQAEHRLSA